MNEKSFPRFLVVMRLFCSCCFVSQPITCRFTARRYSPFSHSRFVKTWISGGFSLGICGLPILLTWWLPGRLQALAAVNNLSRTGPGFFNTMVGLAGLAAWEHWLYPRYIKGTWRRMFSAMQGLGLYYWQIDGSLFGSSRVLAIAFYLTRTPPQNTYKAPSLRARY